MASMLLPCLVVAGPVFAMERVVFRHNDQQRQLQGRVVVEAQDGGLLFQTPDDALWAIEPDRLVQRTRDDAPFRLLSRDELSKKLLAELPEGFDVLSTAHYLICYNTSREYAQWVGSLFERLYLAFTNYWGRRGFHLSEPALPLVAIVFADRASYSQHTRAELGALATSIPGYYSLTTNRMTMVDLTGMSLAGHARGRSGGQAQINRILAQPEAERTVATIIHEATHQIAFNCGLHTRLSDCPMWFSEGIALYFETPDLTSAKGWKSIGAINRVHLAQFQDYLPRRPPDSLAALLTDDKRFRDQTTSRDAYCEAWALTYYLMSRRSKEYVAYLRGLARKKPLVWDDAATRLAEFKQAFGEDLTRLDSDFVKFMSTLR
jgi:hypothetical protein